MHWQCDWLIAYQVEIYGKDLTQGISSVDVNQGQGKERNNAELEEPRAPEKHAGEAEQSGELARRRLAQLSGCAESQFLGSARSAHLRNFADAAMPHAIRSCFTRKDQNPPHKV